MVGQGRDVTELSRREEDLPEILLMLRADEGAESDEDQKH
jgi:hypothetical protein